MFDNSRSVSRREFLKLAGIAGATVGVGTGLGGLLSACGGEDTTTTTAAVTSTTAGATTSSEAATTTSVSAAEELGRELVIGYCRPVTGALAAYGIPNEYVMKRAMEAYGDGIVCADGKKHPIKIVAKDTQSDTNRAAQVAGDAINNDKADIIMGGGTVDTVGPIADQAEANLTPCLTTDCPYENFVGARTNNDLTKTFKWTYNAGWAVGDLVQDYVAYWNALTTNKKIATIFGNNALGTVWMHIWPDLFPKLGFTPTVADLYQPGTDDYTASITQFKKDGCELMLGLFTPPDFSNFWKQALQQGWNPKAIQIGVALDFPTAATSLGDLCINMGGAGLWGPAYPYSSALLGGETTAEFTASYEADTGEQWSHPLVHMLLWEWAADVFKRTADIDDKESILKAVEATKMDTIGGPIDFTAAITDDVGTAHNHKNNCKTPVTCIQWRKSPEGSKFPYQMVTVVNAAAPMVPVEDEVKPLIYS